MSFPNSLGGSGYGMRPFGNGAAAGNSSDPQAQMEKTISGAMESCAAKTMMSGVMGFALGGAFGLFMSSMSYDSSLTPASQAISNLPLRQQLRAGLKDMGTRSLSSARNFGIVGAVFAGTECCIEGLRAKNDTKNGIAAGCITGGVLALKAGPQAAALGCAGFAAFSAAIEYYLRMPSES